MDKIKVAICDDNQYLCDCYCYTLGNENDIIIVGSAFDKAGCIDLLKKQPIDVLLLDIQMDTATTGLELIPIAQALQPDIKIIMLTVSEDENCIFQAFTLGASDYFLKTLPMSEISSSIHAVYNNTCVLRPVIAKKILDASQKIARNQNSLLLVLNIMTKLSTSEFEILKMLYNGKTCADIANERYVSESTIRTHIGRILKKFECDNTKKLIMDLKDVQAFDIFDKL